MTIKARLLTLVSMITLMSKSRSLYLGRSGLFRSQSNLRKVSSRTLRSRLSNSSDDGANGSDTLQKHLVQWKTSDGTISFDAFDGETLRTAALRRGIVSPHNGRARLINCRGIGTCGTCAVEVETMNSVEPVQRSAVERARLAFPPHGGDSQSPHLRLACQVQVRGGVVVTKRTGFWGQCEDLAEASQAQTFFGEYEFILDTKSPSVKWQE
jgi:ferredoxin